MAHPMANRPQTLEPIVAAPTSFSVSRGKRARAKRVVLYSPGGGGKTTLASFAPQPLFLDLETSSDGLDLARIDGIRTWTDLRSALQSKELLDGFKTVVIDSGTKAEEFCYTWTLTNVPTDRGAMVTRIEDYGYGKGYQHAFDSFMPLLGDLDRVVDRGINVVMICHECISDTPNPEGENYIRFEPRLQAGKSGKASIRERVCEWADTVAYISFDTIAKDGKARGGGTRTIYHEQRPTWRAKHRGERIAPLAWNDPKNDAGFWAKVLA